MAKYIYILLFIYSDNSVWSIYHILFWLDLTSNQIDCDLPCLYKSAFQNQFNEGYWSAVSMDTLVKLSDMITGNLLNIFLSL